MPKYLAIRFSSLLDAREHGIPHVEYCQGNGSPHLLPRHKLSGSHNRGAHCKRALRMGFLYCPKYYARNGWGFLTEG